MSTHFLSVPHIWELITPYKSAILTISSSSHANNPKTAHDEVPEQVLIRYEHDLNILYISRQFFINHPQPMLLKSMQRYQSYKGPRQLRLDKGTGRKSNPQTCYCFDLNLPQTLKEESYGTREHTLQSKLRAAELHDTDMRREMQRITQEFDRFMASLTDKTFKSDLMKAMRNLRYLVEKSYKIHAETITMVERRSVLARYKKQHKEKPPRERVHMPQLDALIKTYSPKIVRKYDTYKVMPDGTVKHRKEDVVPYDMMDFYVAKYDIPAIYEETSMSDGSKRNRFLWFRLTILRDAVKQGLLPKNFMDDIRCLVKENKYFLKTTVRCVKLDLNRGTSKQQAE